MILHAETTKHAIPAFDFLEQKRYMHRHLIKPRSMKLRSCISRLYKLNAYLAENSSDIVGQETKSLHANEIIGIIYHFTPAMWESR